MPYFVNVCGEIKCRTPDSIAYCSKVLNKYRLKHEKNNETITINSKLHVTELFNERGFKDHLLGLFNKHGHTTLSIQEVKTDENTPRVL